jgi:hypothetical protein
MKLIPKSITFRRATSCFALVLLAIPMSAIATEAPQAVERTWQLKLSGQPSGSFNESTFNASGCRVTTKERMAMEINRLGSKVSITNETETVENTIARCDDEQLGKLPRDST